MFPRLSAGSGVGGCWWAKHVVTEKRGFRGKRPFEYAGGQPRAKRPLETKKSCVHGVVACLKPGLAIVPRSRVIPPSGFQFGQRCHRAATFQRKCGIVAIPRGGVAVVSHSRLCSCEAVCGS